MTEEKKSIQESWLIGVLDERYRNVFDEVLECARRYLQGWNESEVRECWNDFERYLTWYNENFGKRHYMTTWPILIHKRLSMFLIRGQFDLFLKKWGPKFIKTRHPMRQDLKVPLENILGSLFIFKMLSVGEMNAVMDMWILVHDNHENTLDMMIVEKIAEVEGVRKNKKNIAMAERKNSLKALVKNTLKPNINLSPHAIWGRIKKMSDDELKAYRIASIGDNQITYYTKKTPTKKRSFGRIVCEAKKDLRLLASKIEK